MKLDEWNRRIPFDRTGVQLLGAALLLRVRMHRSRSEDLERGRVEAETAPEPVNSIDWPFDLAHYTRERKEWEDQEHDLILHLDLLEAPANVFERAKGLRAKDFQYRWDMLMAHKFLMGYCDQRILKPSLNKK